MASELQMYLIILLAVSSIAQGSSDKKNVLFFAVDDLRPQLGAYGHKDVISPNMDYLASKSLVFERAYCQIAFCSPSRASLLTARRPDTNHVWQISGEEYWRTFTNATTIPQYFKDNGYISVGMGKVFHPGAPSGHDDIKYSWSLPYYHSPIEGEYGPGNHTSSSWAFEGFEDNQLPDGQIADNALQTIRQLKQNKTNGETKPFFLAVGFHKPHLPFLAPKKYFDMYPPASEFDLPPNPDPPKGSPPIAFSVWEYIRGFKDTKVFFPNVEDCYKNANVSMYGKDCRMSDDKVRELRRGYHAALTYTDTQIGKVLTELSHQGFDDDTIIVLWGDHGWQLGEHNEWGKFTNYEDAVHVPLMISIPGTTDNGMRTDALVELIDIFPTLVELTGIEKIPLCSENNNKLLACVEGTSFAPLFSDPKQQWKKAAFSQYARPLSGLQAIPDKPQFPSNEHEESVMGYTIRVDQYRFTEWYRFNRATATPDFSQVWGTELYNHTEPIMSFNDENVNLYDNPDMKETVDELRKMLQAGWRAVKID